MVGSPARATAYVLYIRVLDRQLSIARSMRSIDPSRCSPFFTMISVLVFLLFWTTFCRGNEGNNVTSLDWESHRDEEHPVKREEIVNNDTVIRTWDKAVQAYLDEDWDACIQGFRNLIYKYKKYKDVVVNCRKKCRDQARDSMPIFRENIDDMLFYEKKIKQTLCILKCHEEYRNVAGKNALKRIPRKDELKLMLAEHYEYLHGCYFQKKYYQEAANAVFTYLIHHRDHKPSQASLAYYMSLPEVNKDLIHNLEAEPFVNDYMKGVKAYESEFYEEAISRIEASWRAFLKSEERCRLYCEGPYEQGWNLEFTTAIANHFVYTLRCKRFCSRFLSTINGEQRSDFFMNHFNYLQFAYYKLGDIKKACEAVANYLTFSPSNEAMLANKDYYASLPMVEENYFTPREEIINYVKRQEYELRVLLYIAEEFNEFEQKDKIAKSSPKYEEKKNEDQNLPLLNNNSLFNKNIYEVQGIHLIADNKILGGKTRYLLESLIDQQKCESIKHLTEMTAWEGDGYEDNKSPHSKFELFKGVAIDRLALLAYFGLLEPNMLKLLLNVTEIIREKTQRIHENDRYLYITYTHLVCRTALPDSPKNRSDYSHAIHADNCLIEYNGICRSESPAYTWRDYSSILYLNDNYQGGNFVFVNDKNASVIESRIRPKCGRMLTFSSGSDNLHGVTAVTKGSRCALAVWFTLQQLHEDIDRKLAEAVLENIEKDGPAELNGSLDSMENFARYRKTLLERFLIS